MSEERYSYSKLSTFAQCPYKYKLVYLDKHFINCPSIATDFGTLIHHIEEEIGKSIAEGRKIDYNTLLTEFDNEINRIRSAYPAEFTQLDKSDRTYADKADFYRNYAIYRLEKRLKDHSELEIVGLEKEFFLQFDSYLFHGFIDRIFYDKEKDTYIIEDIKTYCKPLQPRELKTPLQHVIYSLALKSINIDNIRCTYDLPLCNLIQDVSSDYLERGILSLTKIFDEIKYSDFAPKATPLCHWCPFSATYPNQPSAAKGLCPYFCKWTKETKDLTPNYRWLGVKKHQQILENFKKEVEFK